MLTLSKQSDYALIILSQLIGKEEYIPLSELVKHTNLPQRFLARIAARLVSEKLLLSREGRIGGYKLTSHVEKINFYDFLRIFEKRLDFLNCLEPHADKCRFEKVCKHRKGVRTKLNEIVMGQLKQTRLLDIF